MLHEAMQRGEVTPPIARDRLARIGRLPIRLLGDGVLRRRAWDVATKLGWASTYDAEYVALTLLQADALVTLDEDLAKAVEGIVDDGAPSTHCVRRDATCRKHAHPGRGVRRVPTLSAKRALRSPGHPSGRRR